jgi:hypothetical protein
MVEGGGFEPPKLSRQIYSLIPLATREPLPKRAGHSADQHSACQRKQPNTSFKHPCTQQKMELARGVEPPTG